MKKKVLKKVIAIVSASTLLVSTMPMEQVQAAKKVKLNKTKVTITVGKSVKLKLKNARKKVTWKSSNKKVAVVNKKGKVTGKKAGSVKITAKSTGKRYTCKVVVKKKEAAGTDGLNTVIPATSQTPKASVTPSATASVKPSQTPAQTKKPLVDVTISPSESEVPKTSATPTGEETQAPSDSNIPSESQSPATSDTPQQSQSPVVSDTPQQSQSPVVSDTPQQSQSPAVSDTPQQSQSPAVSDNPSESQIPSETATPTQTEEPDYEEPTLEISELALGMSVNDARAILGMEDRSETTPQGYTGYVFNPDMSYEYYTLVYVDNAKVVGWATMSIDYNYGDIVSIGESASSLSGFSGMSAYDYEAGYFYEGSSEYVMAFADHQNDSSIYAVQVFAQTDGYGNSVELDELIKPEYLSYDDTVEKNMANQLADWVNAFRCYLGLDSVDYYAADSEEGADTAQKHSEDMANNNFVDATSSDGTTYKTRFEDNYRDIAGLYEGDTLGKGENNGGRNPDAFGFVTWWIDDSDAPASRSNICRSTAVFDGEEWPLTDYYLCTGFAYNSAASDKTFATLDFFY